MSVVDAATGEQIFDQNGSDLATPASTAKLLTAATVLATRGPACRLSTRAVAGAAPGEVVLIGGGDPTLAASANGTYPGAARLDLLAEQVIATLGAQQPTSVVLDTSLYEGPATGPGWSEFDIANGHISRVNALMTDGARRNPKATKGATGRYSQPDLAAGQQFARALGLPASAVRFGSTPGGATMLGEVHSPPMARLVEFMLTDSDNVVAEALARQVALARGAEPSFGGAAQAMRDVLAELGLPVDGYALVDGSGLSDQNRVTARLLTATLARAASPEAEDLRAVLSGLPVAGYSGTLADRYGKPATGGSAVGMVRAKTGTLSHVNALAGVIVDADGRLLVFAIVADHTPSAAAEVVLDRIAAAIAACGCS